MICERKHWYYSADKSMRGYNEKQEDISDEFYLGYISDKEYIGHRTAMVHGLLAVIGRDKFKMKSAKDKVMPKIDITGYGGYHGSEFNSNLATKFSRKDLIKLIDYMDDTDDLIIYASDMTFDREYFKTLKDT